MNVKNFLIAGIVGGIVDWLLGWLFYGTLLLEYMGEGTPKNMMFITLGCLTYGMFISYIYTRWAQISTAATGLKAGAAIGLFYGLIGNFFKYSMTETPPYEKIGVDLVVMIVMTAIVGAVVGLVIGKL